VWYRLATFAVMVIAINLRILAGDIQLPRLLLDYFQHIARVNSQHQFYFISNRELEIPLLPNVQRIILPQQSSNPLLWKLWYHYRLPAMVNKIKANVLVSAGAVGCLRTAIPQCVFVSDLSFVQHPEWYSSRFNRFIKAALPQYVKKATAVITVAATVQNELVKNFAASESKIIVAAVAPKPLPVLSADARTSVKEQYTQGNEYFIYYGPVENSSYLTNLLKAFSLFKKRQKSALRLVLLTDHIPAGNAFVESLRSYKYRDEVHLLERIDETSTASIVAAAFGAIHLLPFYSSVLFLTAALQCNIPVIAGDAPLLKECLDDAALYADPGDINAVAAQLMTLYKDEKVQTGLIEAGKRLYQTDKDLFWQTILAAAERFT